MCRFVNKKENTWCVALVELCSRIKYSSIFYVLYQVGSGMDGTTYEADRNGNPNVFNVERNEDGLWLNNNWAKPTNDWNPSDEFVFRFRKYISPALTRCGFSSLGYSNFFANHQTFCRPHPILSRYPQIVYWKLAWPPMPWK